ncbi:bifunctional proline dehydrogenase/L-glutamate gamma-semialdehyde dehydrogenase [Desertimonas flava]|uniref:bifunctional proline dehydrogenase/L-glutamate gamma-semialdehyde dehydrogenase n=1 Tax=Desertimonas flava TaxID=2064846 RepID=UPI0013C461B3|nr:bifunctional proline dehydrogenase/L-glutamate gamma-semialdehyde dehydrogenase [Desertimonas flava]
MSPLPEPDRRDADSNDDGRVERSIALADRLLRAAQQGATSAERRQQERLGALVTDPDGRDLVQRLTDEVLRLDRPRAAAGRFGSLVASGVPRSVGAADRLLMRAGAVAGRLAPFAVVPLMKRRIVAETRGLVIPAENGPLTKHLSRRSADGTRQNLNLLGEAILSDAEAATRIDRVVALLRRPDVDYVSVKISSLCALLDVYAFDHTLDRIAVALRKVYDAALESTPPAFVNLDMEEYADLDLTLAAFMRVLDEPRYHRLPAGIVLQAYLPDSHDAMERLGAWAIARVESGGAPIKVRIVKGANLAMEHVDAEQHGWVAATYPTKADTDASYKRLLDSCLRPDWARAVRVGVASHNLFDLAWALTLRAELPPERQAMIEFEMLEGIVPAQARAVHEVAGNLLLYCPIVREDEVEASLAYLARRLDENTSPENFLRAMFDMTPGSAEFTEQARRFRSAVDARAAVSTTPRRPGVAVDASDVARDGGFVNQPDTDWTAAANRAAMTAALAAVATGAAGAHDVPILDTVEAIEAVIATAAGAVSAWSQRGAAARAEVLRRVADRMETSRFETLAVMADEAAKIVREGDPEVSEAVDFARYYATAQCADGAEPYGVVVVASPWNFPYAIPAGGVLAALMAGNAVVLKPAPETRRTAWLLVNQMWDAGVPRDVLQYVACPDDEVGRRLITHDDVATVVLTGAHATAQLFLGWKPSLRLLAETSGKNAIVVTESADMDAAIRDVVRSAFGHAGQKCSAASLLILTGPVYDDESFLRRLADAVRSVRVGEADDPATMMGPLISSPGGPLLRALTVLDAGERWLVEPRERPGSRRGDTGDAATSRRWTPGVRIGVAEGSWFHQTECFGPVLGVIRARDLGHAIRIQNGTPYGLTGGIHSLDDREVRRWLDAVEVGNAYVNRHTTGAIVQRQPFGGWKRSSVGGGAKAGGPSYVGAFVKVPAVPIDVGAATASYESAWIERFATEHDPTGLRSESNRLRHVPVAHVAVRTGPGTPEGALDAARAAAGVAGVAVTVFHADDVSDTDLATRLGDLGVDRLRVLTDIGDGLAAAAHNLDIAVDRAAVSPDGVTELPHWLKEQAISETTHRYGLIRE